MCVQTWPWLTSGTAPCVGGGFRTLPLSRLLARRQNGQQQQHMTQTKATKAITPRATPIILANLEKNQYYILT